MNRRGFLAAALTVFALPRVPGVGYAAPLATERLMSFVVVPVGDGIRDSTADVQGAIDRCAPGGIVYFPPGTYRITTPIIVSRSMTIRGAKFTR